MEDNSWLEKSRGQSGAVMVEAVFIFPIVLFVLMLIIYLGNIYYQKARVNEIVNRYAIEGAQMVSDPFLQKLRGLVTEGKKMDTNCKSSELKLLPYRYITGQHTIGYIKEVEDDLSEQIKKELEDNSSTLFDSVKVKNISTENSKICKYNPGFFASSFVVQVNYEISYPFYWLGESQMSIIKASARSECAVNDMDEFIRNLDMIVDLVGETKVGSKVGEWVGKMQSFISKFSDWGKDE